MPLIERLADDKRSYERKNRYYKILVSIHYKEESIDIETFDYDLKYLLSHGFLKKEKDQYFLQDKAFEFMKQKFYEYIPRYAIIFLYTPFVIGGNSYDFKIPGIVRLVDDEYNHLNYTRPWTLFQTNHGALLSDQNASTINYQTHFEFQISKMISDKTGRVIKSINDLMDLKLYTSEIDQYLLQLNKDIEDINCGEYTLYEINCFIDKKNKDFYSFAKKIINKS